MSTYARVAAVNFFNFFVYAAWFTTLGLVLSKHGMGSEIGNAYSIGPVAALCTPFLMGYLIDRFFSAERVLAVLHLLGSVLLAFIPTFITHRSTAGLLGTLFIYLLLYMPTQSLINNITFGHLKNKNSYPYIRLFANIGWIIPGLVVGQLGLSDNPAIFYVASVAALIVGVLSFTLPRNAPTKERALHGPMHTLKAAADLLKNRQFLALLVSMTLISVPLSFYYAFTSTFADSVGFQNVGTVMTVGQLSELLAIACIPFLVTKIGYKWMILAGIGASVVRYALFSIGALPPSPPTVFTAIAIHGLCYDFLFVTTYLFAEKSAGEASKGQAQGLVVFFTLGVGMLIGAQAAGHLYASVLPAGATALGPAQWAEFWRFPAVIAIITGLVFFVGFKGRTSDTTVSKLSDQASI
ncbi:MFS transporter [Burkholderia sp. BCC1977]|uniref:MFS transporter n=1 Tax=Burkholderia sp. BCC1977 TaxID=2817440 RepID=UPI002ABD20D5|nr:MFS transporter [Burkholderia sp. BCC1977]